MSRGRLAGLLRTRVLARLFRLAMKVERMRRLAFATISQTGIAYPESSLSETLPGVPPDAPRGGDRFPWLQLKLAADGPVGDIYQQIDDTRFTLIVIGQAAPSGGMTLSGDLLQLVVISDDPANARELSRARIPQPAFYLVRPDGYVGLAGGRLDESAVVRYLSERIGMGGAH